MSDTPVLHKLVVRPLPGPLGAVRRGRESSSGLPGVSYHPKLYRRKKRKEGPPSEEATTGWELFGVADLHVPRGSRLRLMEDLGDGKGLRGRFTIEEVRLVWQIKLQKYRTFDASALRHVDFPELFRWVGEGEPGAADFLALCMAAAILVPNPLEFQRFIQLGALLRQQEAAAGSGPQQAPGQPSGVRTAAGSGPQQAPGQPSGVRTAEDRLRPHIAREAMLQLRMHRLPRSGTVQHVFGSQMAAFLEFCARELFGSTFPGTARGDCTRALLDRMLQEGVRAGVVLEAAVDDLELDGAPLYGKSELPSREQLPEGHRSLKLAFDHSAPSPLVDPTGPPCRPPFDDLRLLCVFNGAYAGMPLPEVLNAPKSCGVFISLPQLLARHPDLERQQSPATQHHLQSWREQGQLGDYVVHIRTDGQLAAVLTLQQWKELNTQEGFFLQLRAEMERRFRSQLVAPDSGCGCQRCGSGEAAQAECLSADLSNAFALHLYDTLGEGATQAELRRLGPPTRQLQYNGLDLPCLRCCAASCLVRLKLTESALAAMGLAPGGPPQPVAAGDEAAAAEAAAAEAAAEEDEADALAARDEADAGGADAGGADAGGAAAAQRPPLQLEELAKLASAFAASFLQEQCECPPSHPQHSVALPFCALRALCGLLRSWDAIPEQVQHDLLRLLGFELCPAAVAAASAAAAAAAGAAAAEEPEAAAAMGSQLLPADQRADRPT